MISVKAPISINSITIYILWQGRKPYPKLISPQVALIERDNIGMLGHALKSQFVLQIVQIARRTDLDGHLLAITCVCSLITRTMTEKKLANTQHQKHLHRDVDWCPWKSPWDRRSAYKQLGHGPALNSIPSLTFLCKDIRDGRGAWFPPKWKFKTSTIASGLCMTSSLVMLLCSRRDSHSFGIPFKPNLKSSSRSVLKYQLQQKDRPRRGWLSWIRMASK